MITVPRRDQGLVPTAPLPNVRHSAEEFAPANPVDLGGVTRSIAEFEQRERQKADQVAILDADNQLSELGIGLQSEALERQGKDALGALPAVEEKWKERSSAIENGLSNDEQKLAFRRMAVGRWSSLHETVQRHTDSELQKYDVQTTDAALTNRLNAALAGYTDREAVAGAVDETRAILADFGKRHGVAPEAIAAQTAAAVSKVHKGVIDRMIDNRQDLSAKAYFAEVKSEIAGVDVGPIEERLKLGSVRGESQRQADAIVAKEPTRKTALEAAKKITDPEVRDATEQRINQYFSEQKQAEREQGERDMLTATDIVERTGDYHSIPPSLWHTFTLHEREALKSYGKVLAKGDSVATDWVTYYDLKSLASSDATRDRFLTTNLLQYRARLGDTEFKSLIDLQAGMRKGDDKAESKLRGIRTSQQIVAQTLKQVGINPLAKDGDDAERVSLFGRAVDEEALIFEEEHKRAPNAKELQQIADNLVVRGAIDGTGIFGFFRTKKRQFERTPGEGEFLIDVKDVPAAERAQIEDTLRRRQQPVTDASILALYKQMLSTMVPNGRE